MSLHLWFAIVIASVSVVLISAALFLSSEPGGGMRSTLIRLGVLVGAAVSAALAFSFLDPAHWTDGLIDGLLYTSFATAGAYAGIGAAKRVSGRLQSGSSRGQIAEFVGLLIGAVAALTVADGILLLSVEGHSGLFDFEGFLGGLSLVTTGLLVIAITAIGSVRMLYNIRWHQERERRDAAELEMLRMREQHVSTQLQRIQAQINPHFLYNALNSIASLVHQHPERAEGMTLGLARLFRSSLSNRSDFMIPIAEEAHLLQTYLEIEQERFGEKLQYTIDVDPAAREVRIPRFLLQPLVENAVKHGIGQRDEGGSVSVTIRRLGERVKATVADDGPAFPPDLMGGHGLQSVSQSLDLIYTDDYSLHFVTESGKRVEIDIPVQSL